VVWCRQADRQLQSKWDGLWLMGPAEKFRFGSGMDQAPVGPHPTPHLNCQGAEVDGWAANVGPEEPIAGAASGDRCGGIIQGQ